MTVIPLGRDRLTTAQKVSFRFPAHGATFRQRDTGKEFGSGEPPGFLSPVFPNDCQSKDRNATGQDQPMAEGQGMTVKRSKGQRDLVVARYEVGNELERAGHLVDRGEQAPEVPENEHEPGDHGERGLVATRKPIRLLERRREGTSPTARR